MIIFSFCGEYYIEMTVLITLGQIAILYYWVHSWEKYLDEMNKNLTTEEIFRKAGDRKNGR